MRRAEPTTYVDLLDPSRTLVLAPSKKDGAQNVTARVYWNKNIGGKVTRTFGGVCSIPRNLLSVGDEGRGRRRLGRAGLEEEQRERIGYMAEGAYQRRLERERRDARHHDHDNDE